MTDLWVGKLTAFYLSMLQLHHIQLLVMKLSGSFSYIVLVNAALNSLSATLWWVQMTFKIA